MNARTGPAAYTPPVQAEDVSEVEVLSPYVSGSLDPTDLKLPVSTLVKRPPSLQQYRWMRSMTIAAGALTVVLMGMALGVLAVLLSGLRSL